MLSGIRGEDLSIFTPAFTLQLMHEVSFLLK